VSDKDRSYILWLLGRQNYSRLQLERKLKKRELSADEIKTLLDSLTEKGLFREELFKEAKSRQLLRRGLGASHVRARLRQDKLSLSSEEVDKAYEDLSLNPELQIQALIEKALRRLKNEKDPKKKKEKLLRALVSKGHSFDLIKKCLKKVDIS
jgi:regulatory protein